MVEQTGPGTALISVKELGVNCWLPRRFVEDGQRCARIYPCNYPEKKNCQAIHTEIAHLKNEQLRLMNTIIQIDHTVETLLKMLKK